MDGGGKRSLAKLARLAPLTGSVMLLTQTITRAKAEATGNGRAPAAGMAGGGAKRNEF